MSSFKKIRLKALEKWFNGMQRTREEDDSDDYSESKWCLIAEQCCENGTHCSFVCSLNDWLDNITDVLCDERYDNLTSNDHHVLFRYYTRYLLLISEIVEDFITLNKEIKGFRKKSESSKDIEENILNNDELTHLSDFINTICKHKTEKNNLHVHNHHLQMEFVDFGDIVHENQIRIDNPISSNINQKTTILMPSLVYFIDVLVKVNNKILFYIDSDPNYKSSLLLKYEDINIDDDL